MKFKLLILIFIVIVNSGCKLKSTPKMKEAKLNCNIETGSCEIVQTNESSDIVHNVNKEKVVHVVYFTDPICSSCWAIEAELKKLKLEYGNTIDIEYRMGGLLKDWSYNSGGISKPSDVAHHWDEMGVHYDMPLDGDVWLKDPLDSSYPPSIAFKAAQIQDKEKALLFLREIREMVFTQKKNITKWKYLQNAAIKAGLNIKKFEEDYKFTAKVLFEKDLELSRSFGVRGFPTLFFIGANDKTEMVYGARSYDIYEGAIKKINKEVKKQAYNKDWKSLFEKYKTLTTKEFTILSELSKKESEQLLNDLRETRKIEKISIKNGDIWKITK